MPKEGGLWEVNGRRYGLHDGALHPMDGPGIVPFDRMEHKMIKKLNSEGLEKLMEMRDPGITPEKIEKVLSLWKKCPNRK